ncbi:MAG: glycerophosphodiester phosphodiesterase family protein [Rikenellaceae bacterium]
MKKINFLFALLLLCSFGACTENQPATDAENVIVVAHRADWRGAPENSIQAIENSISLGVDMVEIDLARTKDGELILLHDRTLNRTTTAKGSPSDYTLEELQTKYFLRNGAGSATHHRIPTFKEAMMVCKDKVLVNVDKGYDYFDQVYQIIVETGTLEQCVIKSSHPYDYIVEDSGDVLDKMHFIPVLYTNKEGAMEIYEGYRDNYNSYAYEIVFGEYDQTSRAIVEDIISRGGKVWINTLWDYLCDGHHDDRAVELGEADESWGWVLDQTKATFIQTDRSKELIDYLRGRGLHK